MISSNLFSHWSAIFSVGNLLLFPACAGPYNDLPIEKPAKMGKLTYNGGGV